MQTRIVSPRRQRSPASAWIPTTLVLFLVLAQLAMVATAQTFFVDPVAGTNSGTCGASTAAACLTIAQAITRAPSSGGTVALMPGTYTGAGNVGLSWPGKSLTLTSTGGSGATFIDGGASSRIFSLTTETGTISSITVRKGFAQSGGCALINGASTVAFQHVVFTQCTVTAAGPVPAAGITGQVGGAVYISTGAPTFNNVTFLSNSASNNGGSVYLESSAATFTSCKFISEQSASQGGAIYTTGTSALPARPVFNTCTWTSCTAHLGGAVFLAGFTTGTFDHATMSGCSANTGGCVFHGDNDASTFTWATISGSTASSNGGAVCASVSSVATYANSTFTQNTSQGNAAGLYAQAQATLLLRGCTISNNVAPAGGGGLFLHSSATADIQDTLFADNRGIYGGGLLIEDAAVVNVVRCQFLRNRATLDGGGIKLWSATTLTMYDTYIGSNVATTEGGGVKMDQTATLTGANNIYESNAAGTTGGGIYMASSTVTTTTGDVFKSNTAVQGGGIAAVAVAQVTLTSATLYGNSATNGAGMYTSSSGGLVITNPTVSSNRASFGGGFFFDKTSAKNTLTGGTVASNQATAGAAFFYNAWQKMLTWSGVTFSNNNAAYGATEATTPYQMIATTPIATAYSPKDRFSVSLRLVDYFNNSVTATPSPVLVSLAGSTGMTVASSITRQYFIAGVAVFDSVIVTGMLNSQYTLTVASGAVGSLTFPITITSCGAGYTRTDDTQSSSYACAACPPGTYSLTPDASCLPCPTGGECSYGGKNLTATAGFWLDPDSVVSRTPSFTRCRPGVCLDFGVCADNRAGRLCSACIPGYSDWNNQCVDCATTNSSWVLVPLALGTIFAAFHLYFPWLTESGIPKVLSFFFQSVVFLVQSDSNLASQAFVQFLNVLLGWSPSFQGTGSGCTAHLSPVARLAYDYYAPLTPFLGLMMCFLILAVYHGAVHRKFIPMHWLWRCASVFITTLMWGYLVVARTSIHLLHCVPINGVTVLSASPSVVCGSAEHVPYQALASLFLIIYGIGLPAGAIAVMLRGQSKLKEDPDHPMGREMYISYNANQWFWDVVVVFQKLILAVLESVMRMNLAVRSMSYLLFFYGVFLTQYAMSPYPDWSTNRLALHMLSVLLLVAGLSLGNTMRSNYFDDLSLITVAYVLTAFAVTTVMGFIVMQTQRGSKMLRKFLRSHSMLAQSVANFQSAANRMANVGVSIANMSASVNSIGKSGGAGNGMTASPPPGVMTSAGSRVAHSRSAAGLSVVAAGARSGENLSQQQQPLASAKGSTKGSHGSVNRKGASLMAANEAEDASSPTKLLAAEPSTPTANGDGDEGR